MKLSLSGTINWYRRHLRAGIVLTLVVVVVLALAAFLLGGGSSVEYFTADVEQGDVVATVEATGTIDAVTTVQVGSQVSGQIAALYADFNSQVKVGDLIAQIDPAPFNARLLQAEADLASAEAGAKSLEADILVAQANLEKNKVALREAELNRSRTLELFEQGIASVQQRDAIEVAYETAVANLRSAEAQINQARARLEQARAQAKQSQARLEQARLDLQNTFIRAPIDGTVVARNVDVGQTVAASLQAPTLFTIAQDLTKMLVYGKTDESDVGRIQVGAESTFTVDSFPDETFRGRVKQVRMNATLLQNVVTYDTIIEFENLRKKLLPGMTAYVTIPTASARDVVKIPNGALRFNPVLSAEERRALMAKYGLVQPANRGGNESGSVRAQERERPARTEGNDRPPVGEGSRPGQPERVQQTPSDPGARNSYKIVWKLNPDNSLRPVRVRLGVTDFAFTALLEGEVRPGDKVVIGQTTTRSRSPLSRMGRRF
jgi:HlyD family secretion protein